MAKFIEDQFFSIKSSALRPGKLLPFKLWLYLPLNNHIIALHKSDEIFEVETAERYEKRGISELYVSKSDQDIYEQYLKGDVEPTPVPVPLPELSMPAAEPTVEPEQVEASPPPEPETRTDEPEQPQAPSGPKKLTVEIKDNILINPSTEIASDLVKDILGPDEQKKEIAVEKAKEYVQDLLSKAPPPENELAIVLESQPTGHASTVATLSFLFAIGTSYNDATTLRNLCIAALLHDIGYTQIPFWVATMPETKQTAVQKKVTAKHIELGSALLELLDFQPNDEVKALIGDHHEKFDGTGYPRGLKGFKLKELTQILSLADFIDTAQKGIYDGARKSMQEAFSILKESEKDPAFPHFFNPDLFRRIVKWMESGEGQARLTEAQEHAAQLKEEISQ